MRKVRWIIYCSNMPRKRWLQIWDFVFWWLELATAIVMVMEVKVEILRYQRESQHEHHWKFGRLRVNEMIFEVWISRRPVILKQGSSLRNLPTPDLVIRVVQCHSTLPPNLILIITNYVLAHLFPRAVRGIRKNRIMRLWTINRLLMIDVIEMSRVGWKNEIDLQTSWCHGVSVGPRVLTLAI